MSPFATFEQFLSIAILLLGWLGNFALVMSFRIVLDGSQTVFARISAMLLPISYWVFGIPVVYALAGYTTQSLGAIYFSERFISYSIFGMGVASILTAIALDVLVYVFQIYEDHPLPKSGGFGDVVDNLFIVLGFSAVSMLLFPNSGFVGPFCAGILATPYIKLRAKWFAVESARRAGMFARKAAPTLPSTASVLEQQFELAMPRYASMTSQPLGAGFDVPPQESDA